MSKETKQGRSTENQKKIILNRSRNLFWEKGYDKTTMRDVAHACGFEPGNIYNYFRSKEQLLYEVLRDEMKRIIDAIKDLEADDVTSPVEQLRSLIKNHVDVTLGPMVSTKFICELELRHLLPAHRKRIIELRDIYDRTLCKVIRSGIETGHFAKIDEKMACFSIASMIIRSRIWFSPKGRLSQDKIADFIFEFALKGLRSGEITKEHEKALSHAGDTNT